MAKTEVILTHNIVGLGAESDQIKVTAGYARNYLFPQHLAIPLTSANKRRIEALKQRRAEREAHELNTMTELSRSLSKLFATVTVKTGEDGKMFGTVTSGMIADQLKTQFDVLLDKKKIHIEHPIKTLGEHEVELRLHPDVLARLKVRVESTTPVKPPEAPGGEFEGKDGSRTGSRGRYGDRSDRSDRGPRTDPRTDTGAPVDKGARPEKAGDKTSRPGPERAGKSEAPADKGARPAKADERKARPHKEAHK